MKKKEPKRSLEDLIAELPNDPDEVVITKKTSVREAIIGLSKKVGRKVFTKKQLLGLIEAAHPELAPVAMPNIDASLYRVMDRIELVKKAEQNIYRYKQPEK